MHCIPLSRITVFYADGSSPRPPPRPNTAFLGLPLFFFGTFRLEIRGFCASAIARRSAVAAEVPSGPGTGFVSREAGSGGRFPGAPGIRRIPSAPGRSRRDRATADQRASANALNHDTFDDRFFLMTFGCM